ncbi:MAG TPA: alpha/beta fold hydrolase [Gaiellaceae bacterium]|jgi:3-oxoadipate enol-lactonase
MTVLVLPSSLGTTSALWETTAGHWDGLRLLPYDQRGLESVEELGEDLLRLLDEHDVERACICGLSLGGATALWVGANAAERVDRLVLACTSARFGDPEQWRERAATVREEGLEAIADSVVARWFTAAAPAKLVERFRQMLVATPREDYAACCEALARWDFRGRLGEIRAPTLVIGAVEDSATPPPHAELLASGIPGARLEILEGAAHLANVEQPAAFAELVSAHLAPAVVR